MVQRHDGRAFRRSWGFLDGHQDALALSTSGAHRGRWGFGRQGVDKIPPPPACSCNGPLHERSSSVRPPVAGPAGARSGCRFVLPPPARARA
jgi:hypothetical protein